MKFHFRLLKTHEMNECFVSFAAAWELRTKELRHEPEAIGRFLGVFCLFLIHQWIAWMEIWIWIVKLVYAVYAAYGRKNFLRSSIYAECFVGSFHLLIFLHNHILCLPLSVNTLVLFFIYSFRSIARVAWLPADDQREQSSKVFRRLNMTHCAVHNMIESCNYMSKKKLRVEGAKDSATQQSRKTQNEML